MVDKFHRRRRRTDAAASGMVAVTSADAWRRPECWPVFDPRLESQRAALELCARNVLSPSPDNVRSRLDDEPHKSATTPQCLGRTSKPGGPSLRRRPTWSSAAVLATVLLGSAFPDPVAAQRAGCQSFSYGLPKSQSSSANSPAACSTQCASFNYYGFFENLDDSGRPSFDTCWCINDGDFSSHPGDGSQSCNDCSFVAGVLCGIQHQSSTQLYLYLQPVSPSPPDTNIPSSNPSPTLAPTASSPTLKGPPQPTSNPSDKPSTASLPSFTFPTDPNSSERASPTIPIPEVSTPGHPISLLPTLSTPGASATGTQSPLNSRTGATPVGLITGLTLAVLLLLLLVGCVTLQVCRRRRRGGSGRVTPAIFGVGAAGGRRRWWRTGEDDDDFDAGTLGRNLYSIGLGVVGSNGRASGSSSALARGVASAASVPPAYDSVAEEKKRGGGGGGPSVVVEDMTSAAPGVPVSVSAANGGSDRQRPPSDVLVPPVPAVPAAASARRGLMHPRAPLPAAMQEQQQQLQQHMYADPGMVYHHMQMGPPVYGASADEQQRAYNEHVMQQHMLFMQMWQEAYVAYFQSMGMHSPANVNDPSVARQHHDSFLQWRRSQMFDVRKMHGENYSAYQSTNTLPSSASGQTRIGAGGMIGGTDFAVGGAGSAVGGVDAVLNALRGAELGSGTGTRTESGANSGTLSSGASSNPSGGNGVREPLH